MEGKAQGPGTEADFSGGIVQGQPEEMGQRAPQGAVSIKMTYSTDKARIVPAVAQGLQKPVACINLEVTAMAFGAKHLLIVSLTVGLSLLHVEGLVSDGVLAGCTLETLNMVGHLQGVHDFSCNLLFALGAVGSVSLIVALGTEDGPSLLEEAPLI